MHGALSSKRHRWSIAKVMHDAYARSPCAGCKWLFTCVASQPCTPEHGYFIWHKTPPRVPLGSKSAASVQDQQPYVDVQWAKGRSQHQKQEARAKAKLRCEQCGASGVTLYVHHPNRLANAKRVKKGMAHVVQSGGEQSVKLLCRKCHMAHHHFASS